MLRDVLLSILGGVVALIVVLVGVPLVTFGALYLKRRQVCERDRSRWHL